MTTLSYRAVRIARLPLIWYGRRQHRDKTPDQLRRYEKSAYRRSALEAMDCVYVDPHYYHRADLNLLSLVVDIGAYDGQVAQDFVDLYGCEVHSYEPHPGFYSHLEARFAHEPRVHPHPWGLGGGDATLPLQLRDLGSTVFDGSSDRPADTVDVEIRDVARALEDLGRDRIDYVKINIEGAEYDLLDRMIESGWIDRSRYVLIQFHEWIDGAYRRRRAIRRKLRRTHYEVWNYKWVYELWCSKEDPHPVPNWTEEEKQQIRDEIRAAHRAKQQAAAAAQASDTGTSS